MRICCALALLLAVSSAGLSAQGLSQRGYAEGSLQLFPQEALNDPVRAVGDGIVREEVFAKAAPWLQFAAGIDLRANTHDQVDDDWTPDLSDRGTLRPRVAIRRLSATFTQGRVVLDIGKQFIRWGKTDIVTPTDRFAPRDFLNVIASEFLPVLGARGSVRAGSNTLEGVWVPRLTPSRIPLFNQRWTVLPQAASGVQVLDAGSDIPAGSQVGLRWNGAASALEYALSFFDGFNHLPNIRAAISGQPTAISLAREYPAIRAYGADAAVPLRWFTMKGEVGFITKGRGRPVDDEGQSAEAQRAEVTDDYVLYVIQFERQSGEWVFVGGYAGEIVTVRRTLLTFAPDRGLAKSFVGRASYTIDPRRSVAFEGTVRQTGEGMYGKVEYSEARGQHWRLTASVVALGGDPGDFLGQYNRNSNFNLALRYSF
jgi:hypothetical protein